MTFETPTDQPQLPMLPPSSGALMVNSDNVAIHQNRDRDRLIWAEKHPRDLDRSLERILKACKRPSFAQIAVWDREIGGVQMKGPGIRLAEVIAKNYGNLETSFRTLPEKSSDKFTTVQIVVWDLETNYAHTPEVTITHKHPGKNKPWLASTDEIYKVVAANNSKRLRDAIFKVVDGDIVEMAYLECLSTLNSTTDLRPTLDKLVNTFSGLEITKEQIENYIGKKLDDFTQTDVGQMRAAYGDIQDGVLKADQIRNFKRETPAGDPPQEVAVTDVTEGDKKGKKGKKPAEGEQVTDVESTPVEPAAEEQKPATAAQALEGLFS